MLIPSFIIAGVQKAGTTALAAYLDQCPDIYMARGKEAHVFDAPDFDDSSPRQWAGRAFEKVFPGAAGDQLLGDATPITVLHQRFIERAHACRPDMRWIVVLRDPVARAVSHYQMEKARGVERRSLLMAILLERWRLRGNENNFAWDSPLRWASYVRRGDYQTQLDVLFAHVDASNVLLVDSQDLRHQTSATLARVRQFLQLPLGGELGPFKPHFEGNYVPPLPWAPEMLLLKWFLMRAQRDYRRLTQDCRDRPV